ncbi:DrmE family protein [Salinigranum halophilum]|uniref:DrmE family protein n=1 Tax=Salinigranum halophilum TaxID=2565931 RepID=UPI0010A92CDF|nr:DrmE family protein [Salinigranum halophilum]
MSAGGLSDSAARSRNRPIFQRWFGEGFVQGDDRLHFADTEMAAVSSVMDAIEQGRSSFIYDPLPSNDILIAICLAYLRSQDSRFPTDGIIGAGKPLLVLPSLSEGYITRFDKLREDGIGRNPLLFDRQSIQRLSDIGNEKFYSAKHGFEFDVSWSTSSLGAIFIDLRKAEWREPSRRLQTIINLVEENTPPLVFYTDADREVYNPLRQKCVEFSVSSELLSTADPQSSAEATTMAAGYEQLLSSAELSVTSASFGYPDGGRAINQLDQMKNQLQELGLAPMEVGWVYNLLTKVPVKPEYWADAVAGNFYQSAVKDLVRNLRGIAQRTEGQAAELLINYVQGINHLQGVLNKTHPVQEALLEAIEEAEAEGLDRTIVVKDEYEQQALLHAINMENGVMPEQTASIRTLGSVSPAASGEAVYARPFEYKSHPYQFPLRPDITTYQFETWGSTVIGQLKSGLDGTDATFETETHGKSQEEKCSSKRSSETRRQQYESQRQAGVDYDSNASQLSGRQMRLELSNGDIRTVGEHSKFPVYKDSGDIARVRVSDLSPGDDILLLSTATDDIYEMYLDSAKDREKIRKCEATVQQWRDVFESNVGDDNVSIAEALDQIQQKGSGVTTEQTVRHWMSGHTIGPDDDDDVARVLEVFQPELKPRAPAILQSMKEIRRTHRQIGQQARRAVEDQVGAGRNRQGTSDNPDVLNNVEDDVQQVTIQSIETISDE